MRHKRVDVHVSVQSYGKSDAIEFSLRHSPEFTVGIANLPNVLNPKQIEQLSNAARTQEASVVHATYLQFTKEDPKKASQELFGGDGGPNLDSEFLFFPGNPATLRFDNSEKIQKISTNMIVLENSTRRPVFVTNVSLLVPYPRPR